MGPVPVIYLDTWVWLEYALGGELEATALDAIDQARERGGALSTMGVAELDYILTREADRNTADHLVSAIEDMDAVHVVPVTMEVARFASKLRSKYYERRSCELSYGDAIHIATASLLDCTELHTGDSDFEGVDELQAVVHPT